MNMKMRIGNIRIDGLFEASALFRGNVNIQSKHLSSSHDSESAGRMDGEQNVFAGCRFKLASEAEDE